MRRDPNALEYHTTIMCALAQGLAHLQHDAINTYLENQDV